MKNRYTFHGLNEKELITDDQRKTAIFFSMYEPTTILTPHIVDSLEELSNYMHHDYYFIAHNHISYKGRERKFTGELAIASRIAILDFVRNSDRHGDLRSLLLMPHPKTRLDYVISIQEDANFLYYSR